MADFSLSLEAGAYVLTGADVVLTKRTLVNRKMRASFSSKGPSVESDAKKPGMGFVRKGHDNG